MKYNCELVQDLLPMYHDQALSKTSSDIVEEHIKSCSECRELSETLQAEQSTGEKSAEKIQEEVTNNSQSAVGLFSKRVRRVRKWLSLSLLYWYCCCRFQLATSGI